MKRLLKEQGHFWNQQSGRPTRMPRLTEHVAGGAFVTADAFPGRRFPGKVIEIGKRMGRKKSAGSQPKNLRTLQGY